MASDRHSPSSSRDRFPRSHRATAQHDHSGDPGRLDGDIPVMRNEDIKEAAEGAFNVLARFGASSSRAPLSPLSRWRRSAIRIAASNSTRKLRETARLKALQRTPYPLVLARIKLLLDRLTVFKEHVTHVSGPHAGLHHTMSKGRRRLGAGPGATSRGDGGLGDGVGSKVAAAAVAAVAASAAAAAESGEGEGEEEQQLTSAIRSWDLRKVGGHLPSGPMDNLYSAGGGEASSRRPSRMQTRESRSPTGFSDDDDSTSGFLARLRRSPSPPRSMNGGAAAASAAASALGRSGFGDGMFDAEAMLGEYESMALDDPGSGNKMSLDKLLEELSTTMSYVSDFLRNVPEETRMEACFAAKMDNYKKDQTVYRIGDPPERFHLILTGVVEIWRHPPGSRREKTVIATLKKGQSFGEMAILNDEPRAEVATPTSNCTFLTFQRADLLSCFGPFFRERLLAAEKFFHSRVAVFQATSKHHTMKVISHMMQSTFPAGRDWEPLADQQIYFIKTGTATLEALDRRCAATPPPLNNTNSIANNTIGASGSAHISATRGANAAAVSAAVGGASALDVPEVEENDVLAAISIVDGRAVGTLGHEDELRRLRRAAIPKKTVATLEPGGHFGGGIRVLGEGELQSCMKVTANTEIAVYHMHIDQFFKCASPDLVRALRDDTAFKLTYYFGRLGTIGQDVVVGHMESSLTSTRGQLQAGEDEENALAQARGATGPRKRKGVKKVGGHSTEVEKVLSYMAELEAELDNPGSKNLDLYKNGTPVERYYRNPMLCGTARGNALPNLIAGVYSEGLGPLADKVDTLAAKAARRLDVYHGDQPAVRRMLSIMAPPSPSPYSMPHSPSGLGSRGGNPSQRYTGPGTPVGAGAALSTRPTSPLRMPSRMGHRPPPLAVDGGASAAAATAAAAPGALGGVNDSWAHGRGPASPTAGGVAPAGRASSATGLRSRPRSSPHSAAFNVALSYAGDTTEHGGTDGDPGDAGSLRRSGALTAAGFIWQRMRDMGGRAPPQIRQCLTYDEISHVKAEANKAMSGSSTPTGGKPQVAGSLSNTQSGYFPQGLAGSAVAAAAGGGGEAAARHSGAFGGGSGAESAAAAALGGRGSGGAVGSGLGTGSGSVASRKSLMSPISP